MEPSSGLDTARVAKALARRWWLVLLSVGAFVGATWYLVPEDRVVYSAASVMRLQDPSARVTGGLVGGIGESVQSTEFMISQMHVLRSRSVIGDVVDRYGLRLNPPESISFDHFSGISLEGQNLPSTLELAFRQNDYSLHAGGTEVRAFYGELASAGGATLAVTRRPPIDSLTLNVLSREQAIDLVLRGLTVRQRERAAILDVAYTDPDPARAQMTVNGVAQTFQLHNARGVQESARRRREFIEEQSLQSEVQLARAEEELSRFRRQVSQIDRTRMDAERAELVALEGQRDQLQSEHRLYSRFLERVETARGDAVDEELRTFMAAIGANAGPLLNQIYSQFSEYQTQRSQLLASGRSTTHPDVERLTTLLLSTRAQVVDVARTQLSSISLRIATLEEQRSRLANTVLSMPSSDVDEARLAQEVEVARSSVQALRAEYQRARMAETVELGQVEVLDFAVGATPRTVGNRTRSIMVALIAGLLLGGGGVIGLSAADTMIRRRSDAETLLAAPSLGVIPSSSVEGQQLGTFRQRVLRRGSDRLSPFRPLALMDENQQTSSAEAYRLLRTNLVFIDQATELRSLVVTSALAAEGKTTTAANLALSFAREGRRVLLIDCDLRRPTLDQIFDTGDGPGFIELLLGRTNGSGSTPFTPVENLDFLPRGEFDGQAVEVMSGPRMKMLLEGFRGMYDIVIFDTAPLLLAAETSALAGIVDGVLLVIRAGSTRQKVARDAMQQLTSVGANLVGFVLNDPDTVARNEGEYGYYYRNYYAAEA